MGTGSFPGVKSGRGVTLTLHLLLVPWSRKSRAVPLLLQWAVRPVQSLCACTRVHFTYCSSSGGTTPYLQQLAYVMLLCWLAVGRIGTASQHKRKTYTNCCLYTAVPPDDEQ